MIVTIVTRIVTFVIMVTMLIIVTGSSAQW